MKETNISKKFDLMHRVLNFILYFYVFLIGVIVIWGPIAFFYIIDGDISLFVSDSTNVIMFLLIFFSLAIYFYVIFEFLTSLKKLVISCKNGEIFTAENKTRIQKLFKIFAIILSVVFFVATGGIFVLFALIFLWVLYEIFFIGFDYKLQNEKLEAENNLTI